MVSGTNLTASTHQGYATRRFDCQPEITFGIGHFGENRQDDGRQYCWDRRHDEVFRIKPGNDELPSVINRRVVRDKNVPHIEGRVHFWAPTIEMYVPPVLT